MNSRAIYFINSLNLQHAELVQMGSGGKTPHIPDLSDKTRCSWLVSFILQAHYALGLQSELLTAQINCTYIYILGGQWKPEQTHSNNRTFPHTIYVI